MIGPYNHASRGARGGNSARGLVSGIALATALCLPGTGAFAQIGCQGQNATTDSGARSADLAARVHEETVAKAKAGAGLSIVPTYLGASVSGSWLDHDGYKLRRPVEQRDCANAAIPPITRLLPFETNTVSVSGLAEWDLTRHFNMPASSIFKFGAAVGGKWLETKYKGQIFTPAAGNPVVGGGVIGVNLANGNLDEEGVQLDFYSLLTHHTSYLIVASSFGFGDSTIKNAAFDGLRFVNNVPTAARFGGGRGETDYRDHAISATVGHVFTLGTHGSSRVLLDVSGGLLYTSYRRDGFTDTTGVRFSDAETDEFSGKLEGKLALEMRHGNDIFVPFIRGGVKHRFDFDSTVTVFNPQTGLCGVANCDFLARFDMKSDDTFWRIGGGIGATFNGGQQTGNVEVLYQGSGDSDEVVGKAQYIFRLQ